MLRVTIAAILLLTSARARCPILDAGAGLIVDLNAAPKVNVLTIAQQFAGKVSNYQWSFDLCESQAAPAPGGTPCASSGFVEEFSMHGVCEQSFNAVASDWSYLQGVGAVATFTNEYGYTYSVTVVCGSSNGLTATSAVMATLGNNGLVNFAVNLSTYFGCPSSAPAPTTPPTPKVEWRLRTPETSQYGDPAVDDDLLIVGSQNVNSTNNTVFVIHRFTGELLWSKTTAGQGLYVAAGSGLIFSGAMATLYARNRMTGELVWQYDIPASKQRTDIQAWPGKPTFHRDIVYCTWYNTPLVALNATTGRLIFMTSYTVGSRIFAPTSREALNFMSVDAAGVYSVSSAARSDGTMEWSTSFGPAYASLVANDYGLVTLSFPANTTNVSVLSGVDISNGRFLWESAFTEPTADTNFDYNIALDWAFGTYQNTTTTYTLFSKNIHTGAERWSANLPSTDSSINLAAFGRTVFVIALVQGATWAYDAVDGTLLWMLQRPSPFYGVVSGNTYYMGANNNEILALRIR